MITETRMTTDRPRFFSYINNYIDNPLITLLIFVEKCDLMGLNVKMYILWHIYTGG